MTTEVSFLTISATVLFSICYLVSLLYISAKRKIDIYDTVYLSSISIVPSSFIIFPELTNLLSNVFNIKITFAAWFIFLLVIVFICILRLSIKVNELSKINKDLIQEVSILLNRESIDKDEK